MCEDCGCHEAGRHYFNNHGHHLHTHAHDHSHSDTHEHHQTRKIDIEKNILEKNNSIAAVNRKWFLENNVNAFNLMSSPGAGKTTLLAETLKKLEKKLKITLLVGDQQTDHDAQKIMQSGGRVKQINTYNSCHLDSEMVGRELGTFVTGQEDLLLIENIGNLVCPASFDLGEQKRVALLSTAEGEDKPAKYPVLFHKADVVLITKIDLAPHLDWDLNQAICYIEQVNPRAQIIKISCKTYEGFEEWIDFLSPKSIIY